MRALAVFICALGMAIGSAAGAAEEATGVEPGDPGAAPRRAAAPLPSFAVSIRDGRFSPNRLEVPAGQRVRLELANEGPGPLEFENADMHVEKILAAGARSFVILPGLPPGEHSFVDEFNPITGELIVIAK
jgi:uncharacterized cupredoxin-like copper-binding protein